jgi:hypothetical protein
MPFRSVQASEWDVIHSVDGYAKKIRQRAVLLIKTLAEQYSHGAPDTNHGVKFSVTDEKDVLGLIQSDLGEGRFTLSFEFSENILIGKLQIERQNIGLSEHANWEPVWGVSVPVQGDIFVGVAPHRFSIPSANGAFDEKRANAIFEFGQIILYSIVSGPLVE